MDDSARDRLIKIDEEENLVVRPGGFWSETVHQLLAYIEKRGFDAAPKLLGVDEAGNEMVTYVEGETFDYPLRGAVASEEALVSAARLLRSYHDASVGFLSAHSKSELKWMLPARKPEEVICHGDFAPYNVVMDGKEVIGMFDFDAAHPAPRLWDIAYAVYCWAPLKTNAFDSLGSLPVQIRRVKIFCESYGVQREEYRHLVDWIILRVQALVHFMLTRAEQGDLQFIQNVRDGHHQAYIDDIEHLKRNKEKITRMLRLANGVPAGRLV